MLCSAAREETPAGINGDLRASRPIGQVRRTARRGRRPAVERSGTNALGVRRPVSAKRCHCEPVRTLVRQSVPFPRDDDL